jgi:hypothetical protein
MKGAIRYTLDDVLRQQETHRPGFTALFEKKRTAQPNRDPFAVLAETKVAYVELGERA